jgi:hypothetical protein
MTGRPALAQRIGSSAGEQDQAALREVVIERERGLDVLARHQGNGRRGEHEVGREKLSPLAHQPGEGRPRGCVLPLATIAQCDERAGIDELSPQP